jgi:hypothetical protein
LSSGFATVETRSSPIEGTVRKDFSSILDVGKNTFLVFSRSQPFHLQRWCTYNILFCRNLSRVFTSEKIIAYLPIYLTAGELLRQTIFNILLPLSNYRLVPSETQCLLENISLGQKDGTVRAQTVLSLKQPFNARYAVEYLFFARILAVC